MVRHTPTVIVSEINIGDDQALEFLARTREKWSAMFVIAASAYEIPDVPIAAGADLFVSKPAEQAFSGLNANLPDAVVLDLRMSGTSGFETLRRLYVRHTTENLPIPIDTSKTLSKAERGQREACRMKIIRKRVSSRLPAKPHFGWLRATGIAPENAILEQHV